MDATAAIAASGITPQEITRQLAHWNDDKGYTVVVVTTVFTIIAVITTTLRLATRKVVVKVPWQIDDYSILIATVRDPTMQKNKATLTRRVDPCHRSLHRSNTKYAPSRRILLVSLIFSALQASTTAQAVM